MLVRVKVSGIPDGRDPTTWPFPTAGLYGYDPVSGFAVFDVREEDAPDDPPKAGSAERPDTPAGPVITNMDRAQLREWGSKLDERYPDHAGRFRPEVG